MNLIVRPPSPLPYQVLDPCTLGRPVHLLRDFAARLRDDLSEVFHGNLNRRYRADFQVGEVTMSPAGDILAPGRWFSYGAAAGRVGYALERNLVLAALAYRYGLGDGKQASGHGSAAPETATEERLATLLGQQLVAALAARIEAGLGSGDREASLPHDFSLIGPCPPPRGAWLVKTTVRELCHGIEGILCFALDEAWMAKLLRQLAPAHRRPRSRRGYVPPLAARLHLTLVARLLQKELPLGEVLDIRVGDVIPISLRATDVLVDDSRLFTAEVAEHKGKLCLTSFENAE